MAIPLPKVVADVEAGGPLVTSLRGINALTNSNLENQIKSSEAQYAPITTLANAASKMAYSNYLQPQYMAKILNNPDIVASMSPQQRAMALEIVNSPATMNPFAMANSLTQNKQPSFLERAVSGVKNAFFPEQQSSQNNALMTNPVQDNQGVNSGYSYDNQGRNIVASPQEVASIANQGNGQPSTSGDYFENAGKAAGIKEEGKQLGKSRAEAITDLGKQQLDLSNSGVILDRLINITQNPEFQQMRNQIPYFQDKQLWYLSKNGTPAQQKMIGDLISTAEAFKVSTVNSFKGKALEKEFNLADKIKIDENDTMGVIQGKLTSLKTLKDIAETKNSMIIDLMTDEHMNLGDATKKANKLVRTELIEKQVNDLLNPQPAEHDIQYMMKKRNLPREEIVKQLKARGYKNVS